MSKDELIILGYKISNGQGSEQELNDWYDLFNKNVPYPAGANLFFYPENYDARRDNIAGYNPSVEDVVEKCLSYKPIAL
jgi:hypothetical protein